MGVIIYLTKDALWHIEFSASKNNALTWFLKDSIDKTQHIDTVKLKAKNHIDTIRRVHRNYSKNSLLNFWLLIALLSIQLFLIFRQRVL